MLNDRNILKSYFTINIDDLEDNFIPSEKLVQVFGAINLRREFIEGNTTKSIGPTCIKCGSDESVDKFC